MTEQKPLLLGGDWRATARTRAVRSPFSGEEVARFSVASDAEVEESIAAATTAAAELREVTRYRLA